MHDVASGEYLEGLDYLPEKTKCLFLVERALFLHEFIEGSSVAVLVDEVEIVGSLEHVDILDDVGAGLQSREDVNLIDGAFLEFWDFSELFCLLFFF